MVLLRQSISIGLIGVLVVSSRLTSMAAADQGVRLSMPAPKPLVSGAKVVTLWPEGSPALRALLGYDKPEKFNVAKGQPGARAICGEHS